MANDAVGRLRLFQEIEHAIPDLESSFDVEAGVQQLRAKITALRGLAGSATDDADLTSTQNDSDSVRGQLGSPEIAGRFASLIADAEKLTEYAADRQAQEMVRNAADRVISPAFAIAVVGTTGSGKSSLIATLLDVLTLEDPEVNFFELSESYLDSPLDQQFAGYEGAILVSAAGEPVTDDECELLRSTIGRFGKSVIIARTKADILPQGDVTRDTAAFRLTAGNVLAEGQTLPTTISISAQAYQAHQDNDSSGIRHLVREIQGLTGEWAGIGQRKALHDLARARAHAIEHAFHRFDRSEATTREALSTLELAASRLASAREDLHAVERTLGHGLHRAIENARGEIDYNLSALLTELREESANLVILSQARTRSFLLQAVARMNRLAERSFEQFSATVKSLAVEKLVHMERRSGIATLDGPRELVVGPLQRLTASVVDFIPPTAILTRAETSLYPASTIGGIVFGGFEALRTAITARATINRMLEEYSNELRTRFTAAATQVHEAIIDAVSRSLGEVLDHGYADYQRRVEELAQTRADIERERAALDELDARFDERLRILQDLLNRLGKDMRRKTD